MENSLQQLNEYLEKIGNIECVSDEENISTKCNEPNEELEIDTELQKSNDKKEKSKVVEGNNVSCLCENNEKSITLTGDFTPHLHNNNDSFSESFNDYGNVGLNELTVSDDMNDEFESMTGTQTSPGSSFIDNVKTESLHFEESEEAVNELAEVGLNEERLQNYVLSGTLTTSKRNNKKIQGSVHPVALKKSEITLKKPDSLIPQQLKGQVTTLLDISSITELKRLWVKRDTINKRVKAAAGKQMKNRINSYVTSKTLKTHRLVDTSIVKKKEINVKTNCKISNKTAPLQIDRYKRNIRANMKESDFPVTKQCSVKLVRVENLPIDENLKIDFYTPGICLPKIIEMSDPGKLRKRSLSKEISVTVQNKKNIKVNSVKRTSPVSVGKCQSIIEKSKAMSKTQKQLSGSVKKNTCSKSKEIIIPKVARMRKVSAKRKVEILEKNSDNVDITRQKLGVSDDIENESYMVIKNERDRNSDCEYYEDYIPSDDDKDDDYHPRKKRKKSNNKSKSTNLANINTVVKQEGDSVNADWKNDGKSKKIKGTRIGRPPVFGHFECKLCDFTANEKNLVQKHHFINHRKILKCKPCNKIFKSLNGILEHNAYKHNGGKPFKCEHAGCPYASKNPTDLKRHQSKHETELNHVCDICGWRTKWPRNMRHHYVMKHCDDRNFKCTICEFAAKRKNDLKQHMYRHSDSKPIQCFTCGFRVKTNFELKSHMLVHTNEKPFKCTFPGCSSGTKTKSDLTKHMRIHLTERLFKCHICSKSYKDQAALNKHLTGIHVAGRKYNCDICGKSFKNRYSLRKHVFLHSGLKPYDCSVCGWKFTTRPNLNKHMVTHDTKDRPYLCPICPYAAKVTDHLLAHIGSFHGDKYAYFCELCSKPFKRYMQLKLHYERMHSKEEVEKLKNPVNTDLALLQIELKLEEEEETKKKRKNSSKDMTLNETFPKTEVHDRDSCDTEVNDVKLNEDSDQIEIDEKKKSNTSSSETAEEIQENEVINVENNLNEKCLVNSGVTELVDTDQSASDGSKIDDESKEEENETDAKNDEKLLENVLITKNERSTVAAYSNFRLPLATRGFKFNYDKSGKKPGKSWFMDTALMDEETAEKHRKYRRRVGLLPPIPRGHPPKGYKKLKKFVDKRKRQLAENIMKAKAKKNSGSSVSVKQNAPRSKRFPLKYTEFETIDGEMLSIEQVHERLPTSESHTNAVRQLHQESKLSSTQPKKTKKTSKKQHASDETKVINKKSSVSNGKFKKKQSKITGKKSSKLLLSTEKKKQEKLNINIRKPVFLDKVSDITPGQGISDRSNSVDSGEIVSQCTHIDSSFLKSDNKIKIVRYTQHIGTKSKSGNISKPKEDHDMLQRKKEMKSKNGRKMLKCNKDKQEKVLKKGTRCKIVKNTKSLNENNIRREDFTINEASAPIHVPVKNTQIVMVYPSTILPDTCMPTSQSNVIDNNGIILSDTSMPTCQSNVIDNQGLFVQTDHTTYCERVEVKQDIEANDNAPGFEEKIDRGDNSDKDIMQQEYSATVKQEPGLSLYSI